MTHVASLSGSNHDPVFEGGKENKDLSLHYRSDEEKHILEQKTEGGTGLLDSGEPCCMKN